MTRWLLTLALAALAAVRLDADLTITTVATLEGAMAALSGGGGGAPKIVTRIKGNKSRTDVEMGTQAMATIIDLTTKQAIFLNPAEKTAQVLDPLAAAKSGAVPVPKMQTTVKPTGQKRAIEGLQCEEFSVAMKMDLAFSKDADMPPAAAATLKDIRMMMNGSYWVAKDAPGSAEYQAFQANAAKHALSVLSGGRTSAMPTGMENLLTGFTEAPGIPCLADLTMSAEGTGPIVDLMKQMGPMKVIARTTAVSTEPLPDALFQVPADYKMLK